MTHKERVANGMALLDEHYPGWLDYIDLDVLDISDPFSCVCGQLWKHGFFDENWGLFEDIVVGRNAGIMAVGFDDYRQLTVEWKLAIEERRKVVFA